MKKVFIALTAMALSFGAMAQQSNMGNTQMQKTEGCVIMKDGKMMVMKDGKTMMMDKDMTMQNGAVVMTNGMVKMKDGKTMMLKDGDRVYMNGRVQKPKHMKMKASPKMKKDSTMKKY